MAGYDPKPMDPHETTGRLAAKIARGETLTDAEERELADARAEIMDRPDVSAAEAAIWDGMRAEMSSMMADMMETLRMGINKLAEHDPEAAEELRVKMAAMEVQP